MLAEKYVKAIAYLKKRPDEIHKAWQDGPVCLVWSAHPASCLFADAGPFKTAGCLTQVRSGECVAATPELTAAIRADVRIPTCPEDVTLESLPVLAEWQMRLTAELGEDRG